ncbi:MAG: flagellar biosynthesis protein FlhA [Phycisphaeraceae bacterium]|nr:flagellar biosynthesis protein FlhA [Phycisphaeraceae bacterium]
MAKTRTNKPAPAWALAVARHSSLFVPLAFIMLLAVIVVPLPPMVLDALIAINISIAVIMLMTTVYLEEPLQFSVFPSLLLGTTLMRLVLNIASTRLILTADASTPEEAMGVAGKVISAFGTFVAGDSLIVGAIIFLILIIVQFVVITKGATRISEVAARFTLDAMPGKQMAIDADLNAGIIDEKEARQRRELIADEADFFGAMDGASKFVRGDAVAGIIITVVNIVGGFAVGAIEKHWPITDTASIFTKLTIGDGLVSQIPSFVISIAAGLIVTRAGAKASLGEELTTQMTSRPIAMFIAAGFMAALAFTPLPAAPLLGAAAVIGVTAFFISRQTESNKISQETQAREQAASTPEPPAVEKLLKVDTLELEVGYALVALVDTTRGGDLLDRIAAVRRQLAIEIGVVVPPVRIRDNMTLDPNEYRLSIRGAHVAQSKAYPGMFLAMDSGIATGKVHGEATKEPAFGLDAWWIDAGAKDHAESLNYTVVDPSSVIATHLSELVKAHAAELLSREEVNNLIEQLKEKAPRLVEEVIPGIVKPGELQRVMQNLLRERVPVRDLETIVETLGDWATRTKDLDVLTEYVRNGLRRAICQQYAIAPDEPARPHRIVCVTLDPAFEDQVNAYIDRSQGGTTLAMPAHVANRLARRVASALEPVVAAGAQPVVIASPQVRAVVRQILEPHIPAAAVLGYNEIVSGVEVESMGLVTMEDEPAMKIGAA